MEPEDSASRAAAEDERFLAGLAARVVRYRMEVPAILFLESLPPLSFVSSQAMVFFAPFVHAVFPSPEYDRAARLLEDRGNLDRLCRHIEAAVEERDRTGRPAHEEKETTPET